MSGAAASVRVRRLEVRAAMRDDVLPFRNDLEDALRTASLPVLPGGASLHIRRLALGRIPRGLSRQALAGLVAARLAQLPVTVLRRGVPPDHAAGAVVVPDPVSAAALILEAVLARAPLHWALAEGFFDLPASDPAEAVSRVIDGLLARFGAAGPGRLAMAPGGCALMLRALEAAPEAGLARWLAPVAAALPPDPAVITAEAPTPFSETAAAPGADLPLGRVIAMAPQAEAEIAPALRGVVAAAALRWGARSRRATLLAAWAGVAIAGPATLVPAIRHLRMYEKPIAINEIRRNYDYSDESGDEGLSGFEEPEGVRMHRVGADLVGTDEDIPAPWQTSEILSALDLGGEPSALGGLWLLLPLVRLAGAETAEEALGVPLCRDVLCGFALRLGMPADDPMMAALEVPFAGREPRPDGCWRPHDQVLGILAGRSGLHLARGGRGRAVLGLAHGPVGLARLAARDLAQVRRATALRIQHRQAPDYATLLDAMTLAVRVLAWRLTGQGWRRLARRRGRVRVGPTHVDITYDGRDVDLAVRRAGLDLDPGWVPWLGRVVSLRYDYGQVRDFSRPEVGP